MLNACSTLPSILAQKQLWWHHWTVQHWVSLLRKKQPLFDSIVFVCLSFFEQERVSTARSSCWRPCRLWPTYTTCRSGCGPPDQTPTVHRRGTPVAWGVSSCRSKTSFWAHQVPTSTTAKARALSPWPTATTTPCCSTPTSRGATWTSGRRAVCPWPTTLWRS